ncbi:MAG: hypothetical protein M3P30_01430 [Chloroflexota bacterium]|nr:hypothetical protein [Chloroflexota bacterium]
MYNDQPRDWVHASVVEAVISQYTKNECVVMPENPYNLYGVRGVIDIARYAPTFMSGCHADFLEVETRLSDVNAVIRKIRERGLVYPQYLKAARQIELGQVSSWLVLLATRENAEVVLTYANTFATLFGMGTRVPQADGIRYGLCFADPLTFGGVRALPLLPLMEADTLEETLGDVCRYNDKPDVERALLRWRRGERDLERPLAHA